MPKVKTEKNKKDEENKSTFTFALSAIGLGIGMLLFALNIIDSGIIIPRVMFIGTGLGIILDYSLLRKQLRD